MSFPWDYHPDLSHDRLVTIAQLIVEGRAAAVARHDPSIGDDDWVLGCRAFQACRNNFLLAAGSDEMPWLSVVDPSRHLIFRVGSVPMRFYRGDPEDPNHRTKAQSFPELAQLSLAFPGQDVRDVVYRLAVETDFEGAALTVHCVGAIGESVVFNWAIPIDPIEAGLALVEPEKEGVELPPPAVGERKEEGAANDDEANEFDERKGAGE